MCCTPSVYEGLCEWLFQLLVVVLYEVVIGVCEFMAIAKLYRDQDKGETYSQIGSFKADMKKYAETAGILMCTVIHNTNNHYQ